MERRSTLAAMAGLIAAACGTTKAASTTSTEAKAAAANSTTTTTPAHRRHHGRKQTSSTTSTTTTSTPSQVGQAGGETPTTAPPTTTPPTTLQAPRWPGIARASQVPVGGTVAFTFGPGSSHSGQPGILYQPSAGQFVALDTICTHAGGPCAPQGTLLVCPWHGSQFAMSTGAVVNGPATTPLSKAAVELRSDGVVYFTADL